MVLILWRTFQRTIGILGFIINPPPEADFWVREGYWWKGQD